MNKIPSRGKLGDVGPNRVTIHEECLFVHAHGATYHFTTWMCLHSHHSVKNRMECGCTIDEDSQFAIALILDHPANMCFQVTATSMVWNAQHVETTNM